MCKGVINRGIRDSKSEGFLMKGSGIQRCWILMTAGSPYFIPLYGTDPFVFTRKHFCSDGNI